MMSEERGQFPDLQRDVQRLLGRCMLRLQQYERLMKDMLAHHEFAGQLDTLAAQQSARVDKLSDNTLGTLVKALFESYVVVDGTQQRELLPEKKLRTDRGSMAFRFSISMTEERHAQTMAAVDEVVALRNELVHHLIERFDLSSDEDCRGAIEHLIQAYDRIDGRYIELHTWAKGMDDARALSASFAATDVFHDLVVNGIAPDGSVDWPFSGIVSVLREGLQKFGVDSWARLDAVRAWVRKTHPEQSPEKYSRRTWPQVLHESGLFELQYRVSEAGTNVAWFRERAAKLRRPTE